MKLINQIGNNLALLLTIEKIIIANLKVNLNLKVSQNIQVKNQNLQLNQIQNLKAIAEAKEIILDLLSILNLILKPK